MLTQSPHAIWHPAATRYQNMPYTRCGRFGLRLPRLSLGLWQNFGGVDSFENARAMIRQAFDAGITHFDLANNYGPPYGSAETVFGRILAADLLPYRDEILVSSKAGFDMWPGPYGIGGSRKYLIASIDQSLARTGLEYFDIFYHHCADAATPLDETAQALDYIVRSGRALYIGISNYGNDQAADMIGLLNRLGTPLLINQVRYNLFDRGFEQGQAQLMSEHGVGAIAYSPLDQGILSNRYLAGIPGDSRAGRSEQIYLDEQRIGAAKLARVRALALLAEARGQSMAQMAVAWVLANPAITSCIIGASRPAQIADTLACLANTTFSEAETAQIEAILG